MLSITPLHIFNAAAFEPLAFACRGAISAAGFPPPFRAIGALWDDTPVGLAIAWRLGDGPARLISLFVRDAFRRRGIATRLLGALDIALAAEGCTSLEVRYEPGTPGAQALERTLEHAGWPAAGGRRHTFVLDGQIQSAPWFRSAVLTPPYVISPWRTVTVAERETLLASQTTDPWIPAHLLPDDVDAIVDDDTSLVLRKDDAIVGWALTRAEADESVLYRNVFVRPSCNRVGRTFAALALIAEAVRRQERARGIRSRGRFEVAADNHAFLRFVQRHLQRDLLSSSVTERRVKQL